MSRYFVNVKTGCLHIEGMCGATNNRPYECTFFDDEEQANGHFTKLCERCRKKRDELESIRHANR